MSNEFWLVIAGGLVGVLGSVVVQVLQRRWALNDRRSKADAQALDAAVRKLMAWQDYAVKRLAGSSTADADKRLLELDALWEADFSLIPDQKATRELMALAKEIFFLGSAGHDSGSKIMAMDRLFVLLGTVIESAQRKRRQLG